MFLALHAVLLLCRGGSPRPFANQTPAGSCTPPLDRSWNHGHQLVTPRVHVPKRGAGACSGSAGVLRLKGQPVVDSLRCLAHFDARCVPLPNSVAFIIVVCPLLLTDDGMAASARPNRSPTSDSLPGDCVRRLSSVHPGRPFLSVPHPPSVNPWFHGLDCLASLFPVFPVNSLPAHVRFPGVMPTYLNYSAPSVPGPDPPRAFGVDVVPTQGWATST